MTDTRCLLKLKVENSKIAISELVDFNVTATLLSAFVLNRLDYCNAILASQPKSTIAPLQRVTPRRD